MLDINTLFTDR